MDGMEQDEEDCRVTSKEPRVTEGSAARHVCDWLRLSSGDPIDPVHPVSFRVQKRETG